MVYFYGADLNKENNYGIRRWMILTLSDWNGQPDNNNRFLKEDIKCFAWGLAIFWSLKICSKKGETIFRQRQKLGLRAPAPGLRVSYPLCIFSFQRISSDSLDPDMLFVYIYVNIYYQVQKCCLCCKYSSTVQACGNLTDWLTDRWTVSSFAYNEPYRGLSDT